MDPGWYQTAVGFLIVCGLAFLVALTMLVCLGLVLACVIVGKEIEKRW